MLTAFVKALWSQDDSRATFIPLLHSLSFPSFSVLSNKTEVSSFNHIHHLAASNMHRLMSNINYVAYQKLGYEYEKNRGSNVSVFTKRPNKSESL